MQTKTTARPISMLIAVIGLLIQLNACIRVGSTWIVTPATIYALHFGVGRWKNDYRPISVSLLQIFREESASSKIGTERVPVWTFSSNGRELHEVVYDGVTSALSPGLYQITAELDGGRRAREWFEVRRDGAVVDRGVRPCHYDRLNNVEC